MIWHLLNLLYDLELTFYINFCSDSDHYAMPAIIHDPLLLNEIRQALDYSSIKPNVFLYLIMLQKFCIFFANVPKNYMLCCKIAFLKNYITYLQQTVWINSAPNTALDKYVSYIAQKSARENELKQAVWTLASLFLN